MIFLGNWKENNLIRKFALHWYKIIVSYILNTCQYNCPRLISLENRMGRFYSPKAIFRIGIHNYWPLDPFERGPGGAPKGPKGGTLNCTNCCTVGRAGKITKFASWRNWLALSLHSSKIRKIHFRFNCKTSSIVLDQRMKVPKMSFFSLYKKKNRRNLLNYID